MDKYNKPAQFDDHMYFLAYTRVYFIRAPKML